MKQPAQETLLSFSPRDVQSNYELKLLRRAVAGTLISQQSSDYCCCHRLFCYFVLIKLGNVV